MRDTLSHGDCMQGDRDETSGTSWIREDLKAMARGSSLNCRRRYLLRRRRRRRRHCRIYSQEKNS